MMLNIKTIVIFCSIFLLLNPALGLARPFDFGIASFSKEGNLPSKSDITKLEDELGQSIDAFNWHIGFNYDTQELPVFPEAPLKALPERVVPMLTWEPWGLNRDAEGKVISPLMHINQGNLDSYIRRFAKAMKRYANPIRLRFAQQMIHDDNPQTAYPGYQWYPWQDNSQEYKQAFRRIHNIFNEEGADNVQFVWSINYKPHFLYLLSKYYPGKEYVDWIGIDGYNWDGESFDGVFKNVYAVLVDNVRFFGKKPIMISEFAVGTRANGADDFDKAAWIKDAFEKLIQDYPKVKAIYWLNVQKDRDWRLNETPESLQAFTQGMFLLREGH